MFSILNKLLKYYLGIKGLDFAVTSLILQLHLWFCRAKINWAPEQCGGLSPRIQLVAWKQTFFVLH